MPKIPRLAPLLFALVIAACSSRFTAGRVDAPPEEPIATGDAGPTDPPPDDPDGKPSPTLPLPPQSPAMVTTSRVVDVRGRALASR